MRPEAAMLRIELEKVRETLVVGMIAVLMGLAVYTILGLAWTFKATYEAAEKLIHVVRPSD